MDENLLRWLLFITYGPFLLMIVVFLVALVLKWCGNPSFLNWLIRNTEAQQPIQREQGHH